MQDSVPDIQGVLRGPSRSEAAREVSRRLQDSLGDIHAQSSYTRRKGGRSEVEGSGDCITASETLKRC